MCLNLFKKKKPKVWTFGDNPKVTCKITNWCKYDLITICKIIITQILNLTDVTLNIVNDDRTLDKFSTEDVQILAILYKTKLPHTYMLYLSSNLHKELLSVICHEMVHLKQYESGDLDLKDYKFYWKGKQYDEPVYWNRPWEKEAKKEQYNIEKQVKKLYYETDSR